MLSATTSAQNPAGSLIPPLSGSQLGSDCVLTVSVAASIAPTAIEPATAIRFIETSMVFDLSI
jgi:hypothetical protein